MSVADPCSSWGKWWERHLRWYCSVHGHPASLSSPYTFRTAGYCYLRCKCGAYGIEFLTRLI